MSKAIIFSLPILLMLLGTVVASPRAKPSEDLSFQCSEDRDDTVANVNNAIDAVNKLTSDASSDSDACGLAYAALSSLYSANSNLATIAASQLNATASSITYFNNAIGDLESASNSLGAIDTSTDSAIISDLQAAQSDVGVASESANALLTACN